jgi:diguanylate cyclase (GGDEF)-like protein/PAS domain S-box-containing protein
LWLESRAWPAHGGIVVQLRDVTARRETEEALRQSEARYRSVFQQSRDPIFFTAADGTIIECNRATLDVFGWSREELFRMRFDELLVEPDAQAALRAAVDEAGTADGQARMHAKDGSVRDAHVMIASRLGASGEKLGWLVTARDQSERVQLEQERGRNAFHDPLTGLPNRVVFLDRLERLHMHAQRRPGYRFAVLFVDLDRLKPINDTFGHAAGDELLVQVARRLESCLRQEDSVSRFGGDEFAVLLDNVTDVRDATLVADRINNELALPIRIGPREVAASASIGIAISGEGHEQAGQVLADADAAMYRAKNNGGARYEVFDTEMHLKAQAQLQLEGELRRAARESEFEVYYQPVIGLEDGAIGGFEALLRWRHPERGLLHPVEFVHVAEQIGLTTDIGWFVLEKAATQMREWKDLATGTPLAMGMSLNISPRQFRHPELIRRIDEVLHGTGLDGGALRMEVGEDALMADTEYAAELLARLRDRGVAVTVDNFGTGFSSLRFLQQLPLAALKIDRAFLRGLDRDPYNRRVVGSVVALATNMGIDVIAPGVETLEQLSEVRKLGVRYAQGYLFCEPLDADPATDLVLERVRA